MFAKLEKKDAYFALAAFAVAMAAYSLSVYPTVTSEDSGEFISAVWSLGVAHPPGYPIYLALAKLFTLLLPFGNIAWKVNLFSGFMGALTVSGVFMLAKMITAKRWIGFATAMLLTGSTIFWEQSIRAEVYTLNSFFIVVLMVLGFSYYLEVKAPALPANVHDMDKSSRHKHEKALRKAEVKGYQKHYNLLYLMTFIYGIACTNHQLMYLLGIPMTIFIISIRWQVLKDYRFMTKAILFFALGFCFNFYIPIRASYAPAVNWNNPAGWTQMWEHITRDFYFKTAVIEQPLLAPAQGAAPVVAAPPFVSYISTHVFGFLYRLGGFVNSDWSFLGIFAILSGFYYVFRKDLKIGILFALLFFFYGTFLSSQMNLGSTDKLPYVVFTDRPFFLPMMMLCALLAGAGLAFVVEKAGEKINRYLAPVIVIIVLLNIFVLKLPQLNQSGNFVIYDVLKTAFGRLPQESALLLEGGDNTIFPLLYIQKVEQFRPDIKVYMTAPINIFNYSNNHEKIIAENPGKPFYTDYPFRDKPYSYDGVFDRISLDNTGVFPDRVVLSKEDDPIRGKDAPNLDHFNRYFLADYYVYLGMSLNGDRQKQDALFKKAMDLAPNSRNLIAKYISNYYAQMGRFVDAIPYLEETVRLMPADYNPLFQLILSYTIAGRMDDALAWYGRLNAETKTSMKGYWKNVAAGGNYQGLNDFLNRI